MEEILSGLSVNRVYMIEVKFAGKY